MQGQALILAAIKSEMKEDGKLKYIKYLSQTSLLKIADYPAVLVENDPDTFNNIETGPTGLPLLNAEKIFVTVMLNRDNPNKLTDDSYSLSKTELETKTFSLIDFLCGKIRGLKFVKFGIFDDLIISGNSYMGTSISFIIDY